MRQTPTQPTLFDPPAADEAAAPARAPYRGPLWGLVETAETIADQLANKAEARDLREHARTIRACGRDYDTAYKRQIRNEAEAAAVAIIDAHELRPPKHRPCPACAADDHEHHEPHRTVKGCDPTDRTECRCSCTTADHGPHPEGCDCAECAARFADWLTRHGTPPRAAELDSAPSCAECDAPADTDHRGTPLCSPCYHRRAAAHIVATRAAKTERDARARAEHADNVYRRLAGNGAKSAAARERSGYTPGPWRSHSTHHEHERAHAEAIAAAVRAGVRGGGPPNRPPSDRARALGGPWPELAAQPDHSQPELPADDEHQDDAAADEYPSVHHERHALAAAALADGSDPDAADPACTFPAARCGCDWPADEEHRYDRDPWRALHVAAWQVWQMIAPETAAEATDHYRSAQVAGQGGGSGPGTGSYQWTRKGLAVAGPHDPHPDRDAPPALTYRQIIDRVRANDTPDRRARLRAALDAERALNDEDPPEWVPAYELRSWTDEQVAAHEAERDAWRADHWQRLGPIAAELHELAALYTAEPTAETRGELF